VEENERKKKKKGKKKIDSTMEERGTAVEGWVEGGGRGEVRQMRPPFIREPWRKKIGCFGSKETQNAFTRNSRRTAGKEGGKSKTEPRWKKTDARKICATKLIVSPNDCEKRDPQQRKGR